TSASIRPSSERICKIRSSRFTPLPPLRTANQPTDPPVPQSETTWRHQDQRHERGQFRLAHLPRVPRAKVAVRDWTFLLLLMSEGLLLSLTKSGSGRWRMPML